LTTSLSTINRNISS